VYTVITVAQNKEYPVYTYNRSALEPKYHSKCFIHTWPEVSYAIHH